MFKKGGAAINTQSHTSEPGLKELLFTITEPKLYLNIPSYLLILVPLTYALYWFLARPLDQLWHLPPFITPPWSWMCGSLLILMGIAVVWWSYAYLIILGKGSPASHLGGTLALVKTGPYALVRHPSVVGKLLGVIGFGCILGSTAFTFMLIPVLLIYSWITNRYVQEIFCVRKWGEEYLKYRRTVPLFFPRIKDLGVFIRSRGTEPKV